MIYMKMGRFYRIAALLLCLAFYHAVSLNGKTVRIEDSALYVILAEALINMQGYTDIGYVGEPSHVQYPPLFALLLAPIVDFFGRNFLLMKAMVLLFALTSLLLIYISVRAKAEEKKALLITLIVGLSPIFFANSHEVMSDIPYLCLSFFALYFLGRYAKEAQWVTRSGAAALIFIVLAYLTRSIGLSLLLAAPLPLLLFKPGGRFKHRLLAVGIFVTLCALPALGWMMRNAFVAQKTTSTYANWFWSKNEYALDKGMVGSLDDVLARLHHNLYAYGHATVPLLLPAFLPTRHNAIVAAISLPLFLGFLSNLWRRKEVEEIYVPLYGCVLLLFPNPQVSRYLIPLFPFLLLYFLSGVEALAALAWKRLTGAAFAALAIVLLAGNMVAAASSPPAAKEELIEGLIDYREVGAWLKDHTTPENVVMSRKPHMLYLWSGRKGVKFPFTANAQRTLQEICTKKVDYIVQDSFSPWTTKYLVPVIERSEDLFTQIYNRNNTYLFLVDRTIYCG